MTITIERHTHSCQYSADGSAWTEFGAYVTGMVTHHDYQTERGTVEIRCTSYPSGLAENNYLLCYIDGEIVFDGKVARPARSYYTEADTTIYGEGRGAYLAKNWQGAELGDPDLDAALDDEFSRVYENQEDGEIITNLAEAAGVEVDKHEIQSSGYLRGTVQAVTLRAGQPYWSLIRGEQGLDEPVGYVTFEDNRGVIVRAPFNVAPGAVVFTATEGSNIVSASRSPQGTESIFNRAVYIGFEYEGARFGGIGVGDYREDNSNISGDNPKLIRNPFLESDDDCYDAAEQYVLHHNFPYDETNVTVLTPPGRTIGETWNVDSATLDHAGDSSSLRYVAALSYNYGASAGYEIQAKLIRPTESW